MLYLCCGYAFDESTPSIMNVGNEMEYVSIYDGVYTNMFYYALTI